MFKRIRLPISILNPPQFVKINTFGTNTNITENKLILNNKTSMIVDSPILPNNKLYIQLNNSTLTIKNINAQSIEIVMNNNSILNFINSNSINTLINIGKNSELYGLNVANIVKINIGTGSFVKYNKI